MDDGDRDDGAERAVAGAGTWERYHWQVVQTVPGQAEKASEVWDFETRAAQALVLHWALDAIDPNAVD